MGARPYLLISHPPATAGRAARWWRRAARQAHIIRELYIAAPRISARGRVGGRRYLRRAMHRAITDLTSIGVPARRTGLVLGFHSALGKSGRDGLQPDRAWFRVVTLQARAARDVARARGISSIWSWGWSSWNRAADPDKTAAACIYLWARNSRLCDGAAQFRVRSAPRPEPARLKFR